MDGVRPIFVEHGADPTAAPGFAAPMGSMLRFGEDYYEKRGPLATDWVLYPPAGGADWYRSFRSQDAGAAFVGQSTRIQFATANAIGLGLTTATIYAAAAAADRYFAMPEYFPRAGSIRRLSWFCQRATMNASSRAQMHVYSDGRCGHASFLDWPYPDQLLLSGTLFNAVTSEGALAGNNMFVYDSLTDYHVDAGTMLWFVLRLNQVANASGSKLSIGRQGMANWMGFTIGSVSTDDRTGGCGWHQSHTFTDGAAQTFPESGPVIIPCGNDVSTTDVPALAFGFEADL
jgi:hypothetical protein